MPTSNRAFSLLPIVVTLTVFATAVAPADARDRPGTPNNVTVFSCGRVDIEPPAICAQFDNTAKEPVLFDVELTVNGTPVALDALKGHGRRWTDPAEAHSRVVPEHDRVECHNSTPVLKPSERKYYSVCFQNPVKYTRSECQDRFNTRTAPSHSCEAAHSLVYGSIPGKRHHPSASGTPGRTRDNVYSKRKSPFLPLYLLGQNEDIIEYTIQPQGIRINEVEHHSEWCFRFRARRISDQVVSQQWSNWACGKASGPPPKPSSPQPVTAEYLKGEWDGSSDTAVPSRLVVKWSRADHAGWYTVSCESTSPCQEVFSALRLAEKPFEATIKVPKEVVEFRPTVTVCAHNFVGETCAVVLGNRAVTALPKLGSGTAVRAVAGAASPPPADPPDPFIDFGVVAPARPASSPTPVPQPVCPPGQACIK
jgi:hypothetical protein